jgi:hypothetical protein
VAFLFSGCSSIGQSNLLLQYLLGVFFTGSNPVSLSYYDIIKSFPNYGVTRMNKNELAVTDKFIKNNVKESLLNDYSNNTLLRSVIKILPFGGLFDDIITSSYNNILLDRSKTFFDELGKGEIVLTPETINSEDFLHAYFTTYKAAIYTRQRKKIRFFARLLKNGVSSNNLNNPDDYEEYLKILDELTYKEIYVLFTLKTHEDNANVEDYEALKHWNGFETKILTDLNLTEDELKSVLVRIVRTGCFIERVNFLATTVKTGYTSEIFKTLVKLIDLKNLDLVNTTESINI